MRRTLKPIVVNDQTLALDTIARVGVGGNYLSEQHTLDNFRDELYMSSLFETVPWDTAHASHPQGMEQRALERAREIWKEKPEQVVDSRTRAEIDRIVAHAQEEFSS
jgi:trimethylamine--corrinoid protein Co-methyltransferase